MRAIQYIDQADGGNDAASMLEHLAIQVDYLGGRVLPPCGQVGKDTWRVQAFFSAEGIELGDPLPDGCRLVFIPTGLRKTLRINQ